MNTSAPPVPVPLRQAQGTCARCLAVVPFADLRVFAGRGLCLGCHGELVAQSRPPEPPADPSPQALRPPWQRLLIRLAQARLSLAVFRCIVYLSAFAALGPGDASSHSLFTALLVGAYAADNFTWLVFRIADLPTQLASFPVEAVLTLGSGALLISWQGLIPYSSDIQVVAMAFPAFMVVLAGKMLIWGVVRSVEVSAN